MTALIRALLDYSRVATHGKPIQEVDLNEVLADVLVDLDVAISECGAQVVAGRLPSVQADPVQMRQLLLNLFSNALKYTRKDVTPVLHVRGRTGQQSEDGSSDSAEMVYIEVEDNGIGFDEKYLDRIFSPFQRLHGRSQYEGTGMGLAICRRIVERHRGSITARSTPGRGSTFIITLPRMLAEDGDEAGR